jgi:hypothetical protein
LTTNVGANATRREAPSEIQKSASPSPASIAPGQITTTALSTISIVTIERVSAASAVPIAPAEADPAAEKRPDRQRVAEEERKHAREQD